MTIFAINEAKIKLAWREKYLTDGANEQALAYPRGCYRGFWPIPRPAPDQFVRISIDPLVLGVDIDSFAIYADRTTGFSLSIRETTDVDLDCAPLFPVAAATETWWVSIDVAYTPNVVTTANYRVDKVDPRIANPDAIVLGMLPMTFGDVTIHTAAVYTDRSIPSPTARQLVADYVPGDEPWGLFDGISKWCLGTGAESRYFAEPCIVTKTTVGAVKFQLTGTYYVGRDASNLSAGKYFRLMDNYPQFNIPLGGSDGGQIVAASQVLQSDGITVLTPSVDADAEGFYVDPWVQFDFTNTVDVAYSGTFWVFCYEKKTLLTMDNTPASSFPVGDVEKMPHSASVFAKTHAGTPETLVAGSLDAQLAAIIGHINDRIETIHPTAAPGDWVLLWRSHGITIDANVTKQTSSLYFGDKGLVLLNGGYISMVDGDVYAGGPVGSNTHEVSIVYLRSGAGGGIVFGIKNGPVAGTHWDIFTGWTLYTDYNSAGTSMQSFGGFIEPFGGVRWLPLFSADAFNSVGAWSDYLKYEETENVAAVPRTRKYYKQAGMEYAYNCSYDSGTGDWTADKTGYCAFVYRMDAFGMSLYRKKEITALPTTWADAGGWDTYWVLGSEFGTHDDGLACFSVGGLLMETVRFGWIGNAAGATSKFGCVCNFRNRWATPPVTGDMTIAENENDIGGVGTFTVTTGDIFDIDNWGFRVMVDKNVSDDVFYTYDGSLTIEVT